MLPLATGMSLMMVFRAIQQQRKAASYVLCPRIDQKTCIKCIVAAGCTPVIVPNKLVGDEVTTDLDALRQAIEKAGMSFNSSVFTIFTTLSVGVQNIVCVMSVTSCFAPRAGDKFDSLLILMHALCVMW